MNISIAYRKSANKYFLMLPRISSETKLFADYAH